MHPWSYVTTDQLQVGAGYTSVPACRPARHSSTVAVNLAGLHIRLDRHSLAKEKKHT